MKYLLMLSLVLVGCNDSGGKGKGSLVKKSKPIEVSNGNDQDQTQGQTQGSSDEDEADESVANSGNSDSMEEIVQQLDQEQEQIEEVNEVMESFDQEVAISEFQNNDYHYKTQSTKVLTQFEKPYTYLFNYNDSEGKLYQFDIQAQKYRSFELNNVGRTRGHFVYNDQFYFFDESALYQLIDDEVKPIAELPGGRIQKWSILAHNLCILAKGSTGLRINLATSAKANPDLVGARQFYCLEDDVYKLNKAGDKFILTKNNQTLTEAERVNFIKRNDTLYYQVKEGEQRTRYNLAGEVVAKLEKANLNFNYLRTDLSFKRTSKDVPEFDLFVSNKKSKEIVYQAQISDRLNSQLQYDRIFPFEGDVFVSTRSQRNLYQVQELSLAKLGNPLGLGINSIVRWENDVLFGASGRYVLKWDQSRDWNFKSEETLHLKRDDEKLNPSVIERRPASYAKLAVEDDQLVFLTRDQVSAQNINGDLVIDGRDLNYNGVRLLRYRGIHKRQIWQTPNGKYLTINEGQLVSIDKEAASVEVLYQFDTDALKAFRRLVLVDNKLYVIDKAFKLYVVSVPKHKLIL